MSRAQGEVWTEQGRVGFYIYNGTSDIAQPLISDTANEAWDRWNDGSAWPDHPSDCAVSEPAQIWSDYGGGFWWPGTFCPIHHMILAPRDPWDALYDHPPEGEEKGYWPVDGRPPFAEAS